VRAGSVRIDALRHLTMSPGGTINLSPYQPNGTCMSFDLTVSLALGGTLTFAITSSLVIT